ncbi:uncharacterized protein EHS24_005037 [Apiotrichum porosum]|uniref:Uncharacterized protein n=1 Tax=Apiotrichum porosum TaxID=105984 RepID=A0A427Y6Q2_9TREE|nr:uncharacterized protein EHS24_005037 [Apiotrichum porosum]RSH86765.1 hypothetical protein EHS24_005037 [Apiotrichum porosum]
MPPTGSGVTPAPPAASSATFRALTRRRRSSRAAICVRKATSTTARTGLGPPTVSFPADLQTVTVLATRAPLHRRTALLAVMATRTVGFFATHLGICLSSLVDKPKNTNLAYLALLSLLVAVIILAAVWYIRRERAKTRAATRQFAAHLDEQAVGRRMDAFPTSFFDRVFGGGHMDPDHANDGGSEFARDARAKHRLRNLIIPSRGGGGGRDNKSPVDATVLPATYSTNTVDNIPLSPISARERTKGGLMADAQVFAVCTPRQVSPSSSRSASPDNDPAPGSPSSSAYPPTPPRRSASMSMGWSPGSSGSSGAPGSPHSPLRTLPEAELWPHANARERVDQGVPVIRNGGGHRHMSSSSSSGGSELHDVWPAMRPRQHSAF